MTRRKTCGGKGINSGSTVNLLLQHAMAICCNSEDLMAKLPQSYVDQSVEGFFLVAPDHGSSDTTHGILRSLEPRFRKLLRGIEAAHAAGCWNAAKLPMWCSSVTIAARTPASAIMHDWRINLLALRKLAWNATPPCGSITASTRTVSQTCATDQRVKH